MVDVPTDIFARTRSGLGAVLASGKPVTVYRSTTLLAEDEVFETREAGIVDHFSDTPAAGEWIKWGTAKLIRVLALADQDSAASEVKIEYSNNGEDVVGTVLAASLTADTPYDSDWLNRLGEYFRFSFTNGAVAQGEFDLRVDVLDPVITQAA